MNEGDRDFPKNLALLCSYEASIAEVCRRLPINRPQFNKYLAGTAMPSRRNLRRICDHFGVTEWELLLPHSRFREIVAVKPKRRAHSGDAPGSIYPAQVYQGAQRLPDRFHGYYFRYFYLEDAIAKSLVHIFQANERVLWKNVEILRHEESSRREGSTSKYVGEVAWVSERIHVFEHDTIQECNLCYIILYPSYRNHITWLTGLQAWASIRAARIPMATAVALEYLGRQVDVRGAMDTCGILALDSPNLDPAVPDRLRRASRPYDMGFAVAEV